MSRKTNRKKFVPGKTAVGTPSGAVDLKNLWMVAGVCVFLAAIVWAVFGQTLHHEFVNYDDDDYVYQNPVVAGGLAWKGIGAIFTQFECHFYHPLTMLSLMLNSQLDGLQPGGYHLGNVLLHAASAILLFLILRRLTGALWRSAFVAALFAIHPLRVESVAWVAERKDVLSGFFFMLTLWAYVRYAKKRSGAGSVRQAAWDYGLVLLFFTMGLLSKPSVVTLPFVLLLLDYWPLGRFERQANLSVIARLVVEKIPLFALSIAASLVAVISEQKVIAPVQGLSLMDRIGIPIVSYAIYLKQMFYPAGLAPLYPFSPAGLAAWKIVLSAVVLAGISAVVLAGWRKRPYLLVGWLWYLGMLVPMVGIVRLGSFAHADRYTYLSQIGWYVLLIWGVTDVCAGWRYRREALGGSAVVVLATLILCAHAQTSYWQNSESLWMHTLACDPDNCVAHNNLGNVLFRKGDVAGALAHYQQALRIKPDYPEACDDLGNALFKQGLLDDAIVQYQRALQIKPNDAEAHNNYGNALLQQNRLDDAITQFQLALKNKPNYPNALCNLGAIELQKGKVDEAIAHYQQALRIAPNNVDAQSTLAWVLATAPQASQRNGNQAVELSERANHAFGGANPAVLRTLAAAYAEAGRFDLAVQAGQRAKDLAQAAGGTDMVDGLNEELKLYRSGLPFHQNLQ